nr:complexin-2 [Lachnoclostridium phocaeense]
MEIKNVQIPFTLFRQLVSYHLLDDYSCSDEIRKGLEEKMDHLVNRQLYTQSKTAATEEEREKARKEYLDKKGIQENFRW